MNPASRLKRRDFIQGAAAAAFSFNLLPAAARGANSRIQVACIGVTGKGHTDTIAAAASGGVIVALCDVANPKGTNLARNKKKSKTGETIVDQFSEARFFTDYREMLASMPGIDARSEEHTSELQSH